MLGWPVINCQVVIPVVLVNRKLPLIPPPVIDPSTCKQKIHLIIHPPPPPPTPPGYSWHGFNFLWCFDISLQKVFWSALLSHLFLNAFLAHWQAPPPPPPPPVPFISLPKTPHDVVTNGLGLKSRSLQYLVKSRKVQNVKESRRAQYHASFFIANQKQGLYASVANVDNTKRK